MSASDMESSFAGRIALITGGGRGIGRAIALAFAERGADVAVCARTAGEVEAVAAEVRALGRRTLPLTCDVSDEAQVGRLAERVTADLGPVDILVNNAGALKLAPVIETETEDWDRIIAVNLRGVFLCCKAFAPAMVERKCGTIINIASNAGKRPYYNQGAYVASKFGVVGLTRVLAWELQEHNIRVTAICPGGVNTRLVAQARPDLDASEWMEPAEIARLALFIAGLSPQVAVDEVVIRRFAAGVD
ncbi:MAG: SDR family oxidoreductase [Armatimonadota bacterium]|nr:MAG: SDR family oxidoreductase [Armatimonadota bacterium]